MSSTVISVAAAGPDTTSLPVLVWGIAGASLGLEIAKSLRAAGYQNLIGCDISPLAFGHYCEIFSSTHVIDKQATEKSITNLLLSHRPHFILPGGDQVARVVNQHRDLFVRHGCQICGNSQDVVSLASDKYLVARRLAAAGFSVPSTCLLEEWSTAEQLQFPVVLKPRFESGGSRGVFVASNAAELKFRRDSIIERGTAYILQEYISDAEGEYTIGVLSNSDGTVAGSIPLRRTFQNMLSIHEQTESFLISSGSSQGVFERNAALQQQAEAIAIAIGSTGPLNVQARVHDGKLFPFEINPRFSASTFLRALCGVNEVALYLEHLASGRAIAYPQWREGLALRTFGETFVEKSRLQSDVL